MSTAHSKCLEILALRCHSSETRLVRYHRFILIPLEACSIFGMTMELQVLYGAIRVAI
jgi:hypothetical protein